MSKQQANLVCLLVAAIWGGGFIATDAALQTFDPFTVLMIRFICRPPCQPRGSHRSALCTWRRSRRPAHRRSPG